MSDPSSAHIRRVAVERLGFAELRRGQLDGMRSVLSGRDTLVVMSTGVLAERRLLELA